MLSDPFPKYDNWPGDYVAVFMWRQRRVIAMREDPRLIAASKIYYKKHPIEFIEHWCITYDPRNAGSDDTPTRMPFIMFPRQRQFIIYLWSLVLNQNNGLIEKCRDVGATWLCCAFSVWLWLFWDGASIGWGSRKEQLVDKLGDPDSIFEKIRMMIRSLPPFFWPEGFDPSNDMPFMRIVNNKTDATITGEAGDNIGRGGRKLIYFKDESAHYERPEKIEAALSDNTRVQVDISSVNGPGNVFHRKREAGEDWNPLMPMNKKKTSVFVFDWREHPHKTQEWYEERRQNFADQGMSHVFAQEVDRNYSAAVVGTIIKMHWIEALYDAHLHPVFKDYDLETGGWTGSVDVADEGGDLNAFSARKGVVLRKLEGWGDGDTGFTTRNVITHSKQTAGTDSITIYYDSIGVGAGVKAESNRLIAEKLIDAKQFTFYPWNAGSKALNPKSRIVPKEPNSPLNEDFYQNIRVQAWWEFARRAELVYRMIKGEITSMKPEDVISISSDINNWKKLKDELAQVTAQPSSGTMKMTINKKPEGMKSPNYGDSVIMNYWPIPYKKYNIDAFS